MKRQQWDKKQLEDEMLALDHRMSNSLGEVESQLIDSFIQSTLTRSGAKTCAVGSSHL